MSSLLYLLVGSKGGECMNIPYFFYIPDSKKKKQILLYYLWLRPKPLPHPYPILIENREYNSVSLNLCFSNQNAPCVKVIWVFFQLLLSLLHLLWNILRCSLQNNTNDPGQKDYTPKQSFSAPSLSLRPTVERGQHDMKTHERYIYK